MGIGVVSKKIVVDEQHSARKADSNVGAAWPVGDPSTGHIAPVPHLRG